MKKSEVLEMFKEIKSVYPHFEINREKVEVWAKHMNGMDYKRVMYKLKNHVATSKFPPVIADVSAYAPKEDKTLAEIRAYNEKVKQEGDIPQEKKDELQKRLQKLFEQVTRDE